MMRKQTGPGVFIPNTPLSVDCWRTSISRRIYYFCTHAHSDHTAGLQPSWSHPIYCSAITAQLLRLRFGLKKELLGVLEPNSPTMVGNFTVTCMDANHCPGSVMFLFEGPFGTILHTGDFRYLPSLHSLLHPVLRGEKHVDLLYLDNTYCNPQCVFPPRDEATESVIEHVRLAGPTYQRVHIITYSLGKEDLLVRVARALQARIVVSKKRMEVLRLLGLPDVFSTNETSHIHAHTRSETGNIAHRLISDWKGDIVIEPTALRTVRPERFKVSDGVYVVPYSDHSSYAELKEFVRVVKPSRIQGLVTDVEAGGKSFTCDSLNKYCHLQGDHGWSPESSSTSIITAKKNVPRRIALAHGFKRANTETRAGKRVRYDNENSEDERIDTGRGKRSESVDHVKQYSVARALSTSIASCVVKEELGGGTYPLPTSPSLGVNFSMRSVVSLLPSTSEMLSTRHHLDRSKSLLSRQTTTSESEEDKISDISVLEMSIGGETLGSRLSSPSFREEMDSCGSFSVRCASPPDEGTARLTKAATITLDENGEPIDRNSSQHSILSQPHRQRGSHVDSSCSTALATSKLKMSAVDKPWDMTGFTGQLSSGSAGKLLSTSLRQKSKKDTPGGEVKMPAAAGIM